MALAAKARFAAAPHRRALLAKVHVARKELGLDEDTYRGALHSLTGHMSAADCSDAQLKELLAQFGQRGFVSRPRKAGKRPAADHPSARKARAMWISLYHLGAIDNASEKALEAFARRQLKCTAFAWADQTRCYKLIEALKAMAERHGWAQGDLPATLDARGRLRLLKLRLLKLRLCDAIVVKLKEAGLAGPEWTLKTCAFSLCGIESEGFGVTTWSVEQLEEAARSLGAKLRGERP